MTSFDLSPFGRLKVLVHDGDLSTEEIALEDFVDIVHDAAVRKNVCLPANDIPDKTALSASHYYSEDKVMNASCGADEMKVNDDIVLLHFQKVHACSS